jgi:hypothetical protein
MNALVRALLAKYGKLMTAPPEKVGDGHLMKLNPFALTRRNLGALVARTPGIRRSHTDRSRPRPPHYANDSSLDDPRRSFSQLAVGV